MLIKLVIENFLSFNERQTFSMKAGKARKHSKRIYKGKQTKLTKCATVFGANASGKSNLTKAFNFMQNMVVEGLPRGFTNQYFRVIPEKQTEPSLFEIELLLNNKHIVYGFSLLLKSGVILEEYLYELNSPNSKKYIFKRFPKDEIFEIGDYFKDKSGIEKIKIYGEDSISDIDSLFLRIINRGRSKMFKETPELRILQDLYRWFKFKLTVSSPSSVLTGYPYFNQSNLNEIADLLNALGTGISDLKIVDVPIEIIKNKIPEKLFNSIVADLEKKQTLKSPVSGMLRSYKEFYTFEMDDDNELHIKTIEFSHENPSIYFNLKEESDGTARLLDLIEIFLKISDNRIFVIDEMDRCLHPALTTNIISLFLEMAETRNTQLIITTHESRLLASDILRNDEVCFINKDKNGQSIINPLEKYQLRADKKVYAALFDGTLENVLPHFDKTEIKNILDKQN